MDRSISRLQSVIGLPRALAFAVIVLAAGTSTPARAQSVLDRPPNFGGTWVGETGVIHFNFLHRFTVSDAPLRKVSNGPTFLLATGAPARTMFGLRYATSSPVVTGVPNEWEFFGRWNPVAQANGAPLDVAVHAGWNQAAESFDGELTLARRFGRLRVLALGRAFSNAFDQDEARYAVGGGAALGLTDAIAVAGDVATMIDARDEEETIWGVGLQIRIPYTPHTLSLQATNTNTATLQGSSLGESETRYGFEFTIPFTIARYFGGGGGRTVTAPAGANGPQILMQNLAYGTTTLEIERGTTVTWVNRDAVQHTVTSDSGAFDSGLIEPGATWSRTFDQAGTFAYHCTPHPFMKATIVVR